MRFKAWRHFCPVPGKVPEVEHVQKLLGRLERQIEN
jgi:hypothetical protein